MEFLTLFLGLIVRIAIPLTITLAVIYWLSRLDQRWQEEAEREIIRLQGPAQIRNTHCWESQGCPEENKAGCLAFHKLDTPCWQVFRSVDGVLKEQCLGCQVFKEAPVPIIAGQV